MSTITNDIDESKCVYRKIFASTFRSTTTTLSNYAKILDVAVYNSDVTNYVPQSAHTFKIMAVGRNKADDSALISIITKDDGTNTVTYNPPSQGTFNLVVNYENGKLVLYGKAVNSSTNLVAFVEYSNNLGYVTPYYYQPFNVLSSSLTNLVSISYLNSYPSDSYVNVNGSASYHGYHIQQNGSERWILRATGDAETGFNNGTNFEISRRAYYGSNLGAALSINRATGIVQTGGYNTVNVRTGTSAPTSNANFIGQVFVDTINKVCYMAVSVGSGSADWSRIN